MNILNIMLRGILCAAFVILSGVFSCSTAFAAYGPGQQIEKYPQMLTDTQMIRVSQAKIESKLREIGEKRKHSVTLLKSAQTLHAPAGNMRLETTLPRDIRYNMTTPVYILIYIDDKFYRRATCYFRVEVFDKVLVAARDLSLEKEISASDLRLENIAVENQGEVYLKDSAAIVGKVPSRVIKAGTPIRNNMIQSPIVIESGVNVTIISNKNGIKISAEGIAMQRGRIGKVIRVRNAASKKVLRARVIDAHTVEIV